MEEPAKRCHVGKGMLCMNQKIEEMPNEFYKAFIAYGNMTRWTDYLENPDCVKQTINSQYWKAITLVKYHDIVILAGRAGIILYLIFALIIAIILSYLFFSEYLKQPGPMKSAPPANEKLNIQIED